MMVLREQTLTQSAATFLHQWPPHDTARSPGMVVPYHVDSDEHGEFKFNSLMHWQSMKVTSSGVMCSYFRAEQTSRAAAFTTDCSLSSWFPGRPTAWRCHSPDRTRRDSTSETTSDCSTAGDTDGRMLHSWHSTAKQLDTVLETWVFINTSQST